MLNKGEEHWGGYFGVTIEVNTDVTTVLTDQVDYSGQSPPAYPDSKKVSHKALPLPCGSTAFLSKTVPFHAVLHNTQGKKKGGSKYTNPMVAGGAGGGGANVLGDTGLTMPGAPPMQIGCWDKVARGFENAFGCALPCYRGGALNGTNSAPLMSGMREEGDGSGGGRGKAPILNPCVVRHCLTSCFHWNSV
eukprot:SAG22_NODE_743_length_7504_cov_4.816745_4_plen_191_part_00